MALRFNGARLLAISRAPSEPDTNWLCDAEDSVAFLKTNAQSDEVVIYASGPAVLIHAVLAPTSQVTPADHDDVLNTFVQTDDSWRIERSYGGGHGHRVTLEAPLSSSGPLTGGEKLVFRRSFHGVHKGESQIELSQKLVQP